MEDLMISTLHLGLFPDFIARGLARLAVNAALDSTYLITWMYIPSRNVASPLPPVTSICFLLLI